VANILKRRLTTLRGSSQAAACVLAILAVSGSPAMASQQCHVTFHADGDEPLGALELRVDYSGSSGSFDGTGEGVKCAGLAPASWQLARDDDSAAELNLGLISSGGVPLPQDIWRCDFTAAQAAPAPGDFVLTVDDALTTVAEPMSVEVSVSDVSCNAGVVCGDGIIEADEECDDGVATAACTGDCELTRNSQRCAVTFVASGTGSLGGVQFGVDYSDASGVFQGEGIDVDCSRSLPSSYTAVEDVDASERLNLALVSPSGLALPANLWTCTFVTSAAALVPSNFHYLDVSATDVEAKAKTVNLSANVSACISGPFCGDGVVDAGEACDDGNKIAGDCCSSTCAYESTATVCRAPAGPCDAPEMCTGTSSGCPVDAQRSSVSVCRAPAGACDLAELCSGSSVSCPADVRSTAICRAAAGGCDVPEVCTGLSNACPADARLGSASVCRPSVGSCDLVEICNGTSVACPADSFSTALCRSAAGVCDVAETCTGSSGFCPADARRNSVSVCRASAGACDLAEVCDGTNAVCPADARSTALCRASAGICDVAETCTGLSNACPSDQFQPAGTTCTDDANVCTNDVCNGTGVCSHNGNSLPCNDNLFCNGSDTCGGGTCSIHAGSPCPGPDGDSDCSETCAEASDACTANDPEQSVCNDGNAGTSGDQCVAGNCVGTGGVVACGDANGNGSIQSSDALQILRAAVGTPLVCAPQRCDTDNSGSITSSDALRVLRKSVGQSVALNCPA
jgi:cysteine-rich repeat protein